jgi:hypothetical protein
MLNRGNLNGSPLIVLLYFVSSLSSLPKGKKDDLTVPFLRDIKISKRKGSVFLTPSL